MRVLLLVLDRRPPRGLGSFVDLVLLLPAVALLGSALPETGKGGARAVAWRASEVFGWITSRRAID